MIGNGHKPENKIHSFFSPHVDMSWMPCRGGLLSIKKKEMRDKRLAFLRISHIGARELECEGGHSE